MMIHQKLGFSFLLLLSFLFKLHAQSENQAFEHTNKVEKKPWTAKPFYNDPKNFQFAIISDRTGGHREGVFGKGIEKINLLYPEFVMSVGDLIEGYTKDASIINEEWNEFNGMLDSLNTKFFYVAGNHDYSNLVMADQWKERYGSHYYHFIYKDVLFLIGNSNDSDGVLMKREQIEYLKKAISENPNVRWTMLFVHHPIWSYDEVNGFNEVEEALNGRDYTVIAGHRHRYMHTVRNDKNHYVLGTTGGGSKLRGAKFGEFDHISWVTMTDAGPKLVNLTLSGILDDDISNENTREQSLAIIESTDFKPLVLSKGKERKVFLTLDNPSKKVLHFKGKLFHHHQVSLDESKFDIVMQPQSSQQLTIKTKQSGDYIEKDWDPLELEWEMSYDSEFSLNGTEVIELNTTESVDLSLTDQNIFIKETNVSAVHPYDKESIKTNYTTDETEPEAHSKEFPESLNILETTTVNVVLSDSDGFKSGVVSKRYEKVQPLRNTRVGNLKKGIAYSYYEGDFTAVPNFDSLGSPKAVGIVEELDPYEIGQRLDHYAIQYKGYVKVSKTGIYNFYLTSDDGVIFYIDNKVIINNDDSAKTKNGFIALKKGWHPIRINYFEDFSGEHLDIQYSSDTMQKAKVDLWH